tara:strand:+ start:53248 stop:54510 length:1263 start_codon:yes stop_codon:yes gene_type:complete
MSNMPDNLFLHRLFTQERSTTPLQTIASFNENHFSNSGKTQCGQLYIKRTGSLIFIDQNNFSEPLYVNGRLADQEYLSIGDWITIGDSHFFLDSNRDHHLSTTPFNSKNPTWARQLQSLPFLAQSNEPVLILGESGVGKEVLFQKIHQLSNRKSEPCIPMNCGAISESLVESELFGHKKGAFTGAISDRKGAFEMAKNGTLFLDEIGDLPFALQSTLLRALENKEIRPIGSDRLISTNARIVAATHQNLKEHILEKKFRQDLYFRLGVLKLNPPPLRSRKEDFRDLLSYFCKNLRVSFSFQSIESLEKHSWPGNVRELKNIVLRAKALFPNRTISETMTYDILDSIELTPQKTTSHQKVDSSLTTRQMDQTLEEFKKGMIISKLIEHHGNQRKAAKELGMPKSTLHDKLKKYDIDLDDFR